MPCWKCRRYQTHKKRGCYVKKESHCRYIEYRKEIAHGIAKILCAREGEYDPQHAAGHGYDKGFTEDKYGDMPAAKPKRFHDGVFPYPLTRRSEERRVGKECRSRW